MPRSGIKSPAEFDGSRRADVVTAARGILAAVLDTSFVGDDEPIAMHERPAVQAAFAETDPRRLLTGFAPLCRELLDRSAPVQQVLRGAATVDPEAAELLAQVNSQRLEGQSRIAHALAVRGALAEKNC